MTFSTPVPADSRRIRFALTCAPTDSNVSWQLFHSFDGKAYSEGACDVAHRALVVTLPARAAGVLTMTDQ